METLIFCISVDLQHGAVDLGYVQWAILDYDDNVLIVHSGLMDVHFPEREEGRCVRELEPRIRDYADGLIDAWFTKGEHAAAYSGFEGATDTPAGERVGLGEWLRERVLRRLEGVANKYRQELIDVYGRDRGNQVQYAEVSPPTFTCSKARSRSKSPPPTPLQAACERSPRPEPLGDAPAPIAKRSHRRAND